MSSEWLIESTKRTEWLVAACRRSESVSVSIRFLKQLLPGGDRLPGTPRYFWGSLQSRLRNHDAFLLKLLQSRYRRQTALVGRLYGMHNDGLSGPLSYGRSSDAQSSLRWHEFQKLLACNGHLCLTGAARGMRDSRRAPR